MSTKPISSKEAELAEWNLILCETEFLEHEVSTGMIFPSRVLSPESASANQCLPKVSVTVAAVYARMEEIVRGHYITREHIVTLRDRDIGLLHAAQFKEQEIARSKAQPTNTNVVSTNRQEDQIPGKQSPLPVQETAIAANAILQEPQRQGSEVRDKEKTETVRKEDPLAVSTPEAQQNNGATGGVEDEQWESTFSDTESERETTAKESEEKSDRQEDQIPVKQSPLQETAIAASTIQEPQQRTEVRDEGKTGTAREKEPLVAVSAPEEQQSNGATDVLEAPRVAPLLVRHAALWGVFYGALWVEQNIIFSRRPFDYTYPSKGSLIQQYLFILSTIGVTVSMVVGIAAKLFDVYTSK